LIPIQDQLAGPKSVFLEVLQPGCQDYPTVFSGTPQVPLRKLRELPAEALDVVDSGIQPHAVGCRLFCAVPKRKEKLVVEVDVSEAENLLYCGPDWK
jgi:hypothetical protein